MKWSSSHKMTFYFDQDDKKQTIDYEVSPQPTEDIPFEEVLTTYCLHVIRSLVNTKHSPEHSETTARMIMADNLETAITADYDAHGFQGYQIASFDGEEKKTKVIITAKYEGDFTPLFDMKIKGYGFFGTKSTWATTHSALLHLNGLVQRYGDQPKETAYLIGASSKCGSLFLGGEFSVINQAKMAVKVAKHVLSN
jgi:hypothetical protein